MSWSVEVNDQDKQRLWTLGTQHIFDSCIGYVWEGDATRSKENALNTDNGLIC